MRNEECLAIVSRNNHDFLNHLQVISGLLQMSKHERAREYILQVALEMERMSKITNTRPPEVACVLLQCYNLAREKLVQLEMPAPLNFSGTAVPGELLGCLVQGFFQILLDNGEAPATLYLGEQDQDKKLYIRLAFHHTPAGLKGLEEAAAEAQSRLHEYGGKAGLLFEPDRLEIFLLIPRK